MPDKYFTVYEHGRRMLLSGQHPTGLDGQRGIPARAWRAYQRRMSQEPPWERAERYRQIMQEQGSHSIRALARATGGDHSRMARVLKVLELPEHVLAALQEHANHPRIRAHFTERRLRQLVKQDRSETAILREIEQVIQGRARRFRETSPHPASLPALGARQAGGVTKPTLGSYTG